MKIGVLKAGVVVEDYQAEHGDFDAMFVALFERAIPAAKLVIYRVRDGDYPETLDACHGYVITGSADSVYDDAPWIERLAAFVRRLIDARIRTLGICFGHQIIAQALDGKTEAASVGWGVGIRESRVHRVRDWMGEASSVRLLHSHRDQVTALPSGAEPILTSGFCPHAGYVMGDYVLALQGHPEFTRDYARTMMEHRRELLGEAYDGGIASLGGDIDEQVIARWIAGFFAA